MTEVAEEVVETVDPAGTLLEEPANFIGSFSTEEPGADGANPDPTKPDPIKKVETVTAPGAVTTGMDMQSILKNIREKAGVELSGEDQIIDEIRSGRDLKVKFSESETRLKTLDSLDPLALDIDRAVKAGMDVDLYLSARKMDPEKMDEKESLRREFLIKNPKLVAQDPEFANQKFEREFSSKYQILTEDLSPEELLQKQSDIDFMKRSQRADAMNAKEFLADWKSKNVTLPETSSRDMDKTELVQKYLSGADSFADSLTVVSVPVEDQVFNLGLEDSIGEIRKDMKDPINTLKRLGVDLVGGNIDPDLFGDTLARLYALENIGPKLSTWALEQNASATVKATLTGATPTQSLAGGALPEKDHDVKVAEAFEARRQAQRQGR
jgi:hypothetical protein